VAERIDSWRRGLDPEARFGVVEVPLLFEVAMDGAFDVTVAVVADDDVRRERAAERGQVLVGEREARQLSQDEKASRADHVVRNDGSVEDLERELSELVEKLPGRVQR
jgi:dephospho-CoA kinase